MRPEVMRPLRTLVAAAVAVALMLVSGVARADDDAACEVYEIKASHEDGGIDKGLDKLSRILKKPPFNTWKRFVLIKKHDQNVTKDKPAGLTLEAGGKMQLLLKDVVQKKGGKWRLRITVTLFDKKGKQTTEATSMVDSGDAWLIGGEPLEGDPKATYFVGIACTAK